MVARKTLGQTAYDAARTAAIAADPDDAEDWPEWDELEKEDRLFWSAVAKAVVRRDRQRRK